MQAGGLGAVLDAAGVFFVPVCEDLGFSRSEISLYLTSYFIATIFAMPLVGKWITRYNLNRLLSAAFALVVAAVAAMGLYSEPWQWWISGVVFGLAGSFIFVVPTPILIGNWFHKRKGLALGAAMSFSGIGGAVLSPLFALLIETFGWRDAYFMAAALMAALVLPWTLFVFKLRPEDKGLKPYGWTEGLDCADRDAGRYEEQRGSRPLANVFKTPPFVCMFLFSGLIAYFAGFNSHLPGYSQSIGFSPIVGSSLLTAAMMGSVVEKLIVGWLNDRVGVQLTVNIQLAMVCLGFIGFIFAGDNLLLLYVSAFLFGAQNSLVSVSTPLLINQIFGERDFPRIFAYARIGTGAIGCLGPVTVAGLYDVTGSFIPAFAMGVGITGVAFLCVRIADMTRGRLESLADDSTSDGWGRGRRESSSRSQLLFHMRDV